MVGNGNGNANLPYDIMINILKRVPVKSLTRFKCVAKDWLNLFKTPYFTQQHLHHSSHNNPFLLLQRILESSSCLIGSDFKVHNPKFIDFTSPAKIIGSCNGLLCVRHYTDHSLSIWNPATREIKQVPETLIDIKCFYSVGFGFSPIVNDYKIVRISVSEFDDHGDQIVVLDNVRVNRAEVYSLKTESWKEIDVSNLQTSYIIPSSVTVNGAMFWQATVTDELGSDADPELVASFDIGQEMFSLLKGPPPPSCPINSHRHSTVLAVYNNKLAMFHHFIIGNFESSKIDLWVLEDTPTTCALGESLSWVKQYSVRPFLRILYPLSIWRDEIVCLEEGDIDEYSGVETVLSLFNPYSNELKRLPAQRDQRYYVSFNYAESLVPVGNIHHEQ